MDRVPRDVLACVCASADFGSTAQLLATCHSLRAAGDDGFFRLVAELQWGCAFWRDALTRPATRAFRCMRSELFNIYRLQRCCRAHGLPEWTERDIRAYWALEATR